MMLTLSVHGGLVSTGFPLASPLTVTTDLPVGAVGVKGYNGASCSSSRACMGKPRSDAPKEVADAIERDEGGDMGR
jgi:hypothetical protein